MTVPEPAKVRLTPPVQAWLWLTFAATSIVVAAVSGAPAVIATSVPEWALVAVVLVSVAWSESHLVQLPAAGGGRRAASLSHTTVAVGAAALVLPPVVAISTVAVATAIGLVIDGRDAVKIRFNVGLQASAVAVCCLVAYIGGTIDPVHTVGLLHAVAAAFSYEVVTWLGVSYVLAAARNVPFRTIVGGGSWAVPAYAAGAYAGLATVTVLLLQVGWLAAALGVAPLAIARGAYSRVMESELASKLARQERDLFAQTVAGVRDAIVLCTADGQVELASPTTAASLSLHADTDRTLTGTDFDDLVELVAGDGQRVRYADLVGATSVSEPQAVLELHLRPGRDGGHDRVMQVTVTVQRNADGEPVSSVVVLHDRTADHDLAQLKDDFLARVSHELRTPLTPIITYAQMLGRFRSTMDEARIEEATRTIQERAKHMLRLIEDLLQVSKIAAGGDGTQVRVPVALNELTRSVIGDVALQYPTHQIRLFAHCRPVVTTDPDHVRQVLTNLVTNACKYSPPGPVDVNLGQVGDRTVFDVIDRGAGIAVSDRSRIFERFERLSATAATTAGSGVGLHIAQELARELGGELSLVESSSAGSTFRFALNYAARMPMQVEDLSRGSTAVLERSA